MKLTEIKLKNFRGYKEECRVDMNDFTAFIGKNDSGKSTILEALDIFFNNGNGVIKLDKDDINKECLNNGDDTIIISACFSEIPEKVILDSTSETTLKDEFLLNNNNQLEIIKKYANAGKEKVFIKALHPKNQKCSDILSLKDLELKKILKELGIKSSDDRKNSEKRKEIWNYYKDELDLGEVEIDVTKGDAKSIWENIQTYLPAYSLFQSDRENNDTDSEVQDPLKEAVKQILTDKTIQNDLREVANIVINKLQEVSSATLDKLREMNSKIADTLSPVIPSVESLKWADVFKSVSISSDNGIPINKRGSGVKRLVLLNFFRAQTEKKILAKDKSIIYAIEEPETSQHYEHQVLLINSLLDLSEKENTQVIITTHSSQIVKRIEKSNIRQIIDSEKGKNIIPISNGVLPYVSLNEINYITYNEISVEYHNELYGYIQYKASLIDSNNGKEKEFESWLHSLGINFTKQWVRVQNNIPKPPYPCTLCTYVRNCIHHPENKENLDYTNDELTNSINEMINLIRINSI